MHAHVVRTEQLTPSLVRVVLGGDGLADFAMVPATDAYLNLAFAPEGATYGPIFDPKAVRDEVPREQWPARRRFTVRSWDPDGRELVVDFVTHGDEGVAGRWAASAREGDVLVFEGPAGGYTPDPDADWHLMVGDESALPAIAASLEVLPPQARVIVRLVCDGPDHEVELKSDADVDVAWLHRAGQSPEGMAALLEALEVPEGRGHAFVHGEAEEVRAVRRHLLVDRGWSRADMSCSPYWRRTMTDEAWRTVKRDFVEAMEAEVG